MKRISTVLPSIVGLLAVVSVGAQGDKIAVPANRGARERVDHANGNPKVPADYGTTYRSFG